MRAKLRSNSGSSAHLGRDLFDLTYRPGGFVVEADEPPSAGERARELRGNDLEAMSGEV